MDAGTKKLLDRILDRVTDHSDTLAEIKVVQAEQKVILEEHMRRSLANEESLELLRDELKPLQKKEAMIDGALKFVGVLAVIFGLLVSIKDFLIK